MPSRILRSRAKGWRLPDGAVIVDSSTPWGNPFVVGQDGKAAECVQLYRFLLGGSCCVSCKASIEAQRAALDHATAHIDELRDKDLACSCRKGQPCHADTLIEIANSPLIRRANG